MSQWTHVAGIIRLDALMQTDDAIGDGVRLSFGKTAVFDDPPEARSAVTVPCGSEGSLQYTVHKGVYGNNAASWGHMVIWGDLRNYDDTDAIVKWIQESVERLKIYNIGAFRGLVIQIEVEGISNTIVVAKDYDGKELKWDITHVIV
jgi:hypothetical protein